LKRSLWIGLGVLLAAFVATTWWALEADGVLVIETLREDGSVRATHVWYVEEAGQLWLEAGSPENGWFVDVEARPGVIVRWEEGPREYGALPASSAPNHDWIRSAIRAKYGFRDWWVNRIVDTSESVAVRLVPVEDLQSTH